MEVENMTKSEVKKMLPYNTITKCEKAYHEEWT